MQQEDDVVVSVSNFTFSFSVGMPHLSEAKQFVCFEVNTKLFPSKFNPNLPIVVD